MFSSHFDVFLSLHLLSYPPKNQQKYVFKNQKISHRNYLAHGKTHPGNIKVSERKESPSSM